MKSRTWNQNVEIEVVNVSKQTRTVNEKQNGGNTTKDRVNINVEEDVVPFSEQNIARSAATYRTSQFTETHSHESKSGFQPERVMSPDNLADSPTSKVGHKQSAVTYSDISAPSTETHSHESKPDSQKETLMAPDSLADSPKAAINQHHTDPTKQDCFGDKTFSTSLKLRSSKKVFIPFLLFASVILLASFFPDAIVGLLMSDQDIDKLKDISEKLPSYLPSIIKLLLYALSSVFLWFGIKEVNNGSLQIFDSYVLYKKGLMNKVKIHYQSISSIEVHRAPFTVFMDIGHLEISSQQKDIIIKNIDKPFEIKSLLVNKVREFKNNSEI